MNESGAKGKTQLTVLAITSSPDPLLRCDHGSCLAMMKWPEIRAKSHWKKRSKGERETAGEKGFQDGKAYRKRGILYLFSGLQSPADSMLWEFQLCPTFHHNIGNQMKGCFYHARCRCLDSTAGGYCCSPSRESSSFPVYPTDASFCSLFTSCHCLWLFPSLFFCLANRIHGQLSFVVWVERREEIVTACVCDAASRKNDDILLIL